MSEEILFTKISALLIRNNKVLIVRGKGDDFYKALGGKVEDNESDLECLSRELEEEAMVELIDAKFYFEISKEEIFNKPGLYFKVRFYLVEVDKEPTINPQDQTEEFYWIGKEEFEKNNTIKIATALSEKALPKLIEDSLLI